MASVGMCNSLLALATGVRLEFLHCRAKHLAEEYGLFHEPIDRRRVQNRSVCYALAQVVVVRFLELVLNQNVLV